MSLASSRASPRRSPSRAKTSPENPCLIRGPFSRSNPARRFRTLNGEEVLIQLGPARVNVRAHQFCPSHNQPGSPIFNAVGIVFDRAGIKDKGVYTPEIVSGLTALYTGQSAEALADEYLSVHAAQLNRLAGMPERVSPRRSPRRRSAGRRSAGRLSPSRMSPCPPRSLLEEEMEAASSGRLSPSRRSLSRGGATF